MAAPAASALPLSAGLATARRLASSSPWLSITFPSLTAHFLPQFPPFPGPSSLPRLNPATVRGLTSSPLLKGARPHPCALGRFAPARVQRCAVASGHGRQELRTSEYRFDDDEPLWLTVIRDIAVGLRGLVTFLAEQPRHLKHLEWPRFRNTLRTATLTLILVAVFIVALSSVDAALCYILSWLLRKSA